MFTEPAAAPAPDEAPSGLSLEPRPDLESQPDNEPAGDNIMEPLPDLELVGTGNEAADTGNTSPFASESFEEDETIVITAPGDYYSMDEQPEAGEFVETADATNTDAVPDTAATIAVAGNAESTTAEAAEMPAVDAAVDNDDERRGFFSRIWSFFTRKR